MDPEPPRRANTIHDTANGAASRLAAAGIATARLDAEVLLRDLLGLDRTAYFLHRSEPISAPDREAFDRWIQRRLDGEPVAYIVGRKDFMGLSFSVGPGVLVPRPETELLVEWAIERLASGRGPSTVLDVGTGSGAIALSIAALAPATAVDRIVASDVSREALVYAAANRESLARDAPVFLVRGDLGSWCGRGVDLLLANLPYLRPAQIGENPDLGSEPIGALDGGADGLDLVRRLLADAPRLLARGGGIGLEIDPSQADVVLSLGTSVLPGLRWSIIPDLAGHPRHVVGT